MSALAKWHATVVVGLLHAEPEPTEWKELHVGAERGVNCEQMQTLLTNSGSEALGVAGGSTRCLSSAVLQRSDSGLWRAWT